MVECQLPKLDVAGSSPVSRSFFMPFTGICCFLTNHLFYLDCNLGQIFTELPFK